MARRQMYKTGRLDVFLGVQVTRELDEEIKQEAERALQPKSEFLRMLLAEGMKNWRFRNLRAAKENS